MAAIPRALATMPADWAKRRLIENGPTSPGTNAARMAVLALAAELRCHQVTEQDTLAYVTSRLDLFETGSTRGRKLLRQLERSVKLAYHPPSGEPILSGCCRDPRPHTGRTGTGALRETFAAYCDDACARACPMLRAIRNPDRSLYTTPYEPLLRSSVWLHGGGLGHAGLTAWRLAALLAVAQGTEEVRASGNYVAMKSEGAMSTRHAKRVLRKMHDLEIVTLLNKRTGLRTIHVRSPEWVTALEQQLGLRGARQRHMAEARASSDDYLSWLQGAESLDEWELAD